MKTPPGEYAPDSTEGITRVADLPAPRIVTLRRQRKSLPCPKCHAPARRYATAYRTLHDLGDASTEQPVDLRVCFSRHRCRRCHCCFAIDLTDLALPYCQYTLPVQHMAVRLVAEDGLPYQAACWHLWRDHRVFVPYATIQNWVEAAGEKKLARTGRTLPGRRAG